MDPCEVNQEYGIGRKKVDYALRLDKTNKMFIEVKNFNNELNEDDRFQLIDYCDLRNVSKGLLTNGRSWIFYHLDFDRPKYFSKNNIICQVEVSENDNEEIIENFTRFLSREALAGD